MSYYFVKLAPSGERGFSNERKRHPPPRGAIRLPTAMWSVVHETIQEGTCLVQEIVGRGVREEVVGLPVLVHVAGQRQDLLADELGPAQGEGANIRIRWVAQGLGPF